MKTSPEVLAQAEATLEIMTSSFNACGRAHFEIDSSVPITDPYQARGAAIDHIINLAQSAITTANDVKIMSNFNEEHDIF